MVSGVGLEAAHGGHQNGGVRGDARVAALDVEEALGAHVGTEAGLGEEEVAGVDADAVGHDRAVAGGDVAERAGVHEGWGVLQRLHEVGLDGLTQDARLAAPGFCGKGQTVPVGDGGPIMRISEALVG